MSTYQMVVRNTATVFQDLSVAALYERFLKWWISLYANPPSKLPPLI